jgi:hypothetical protein
MTQEGHVKMVLWFEFTYVHVFFSARRNPNRNFSHLIEEIMPPRSFHLPIADEKENLAFSLLKTAFETVSNTINTRTYAHDCVMVYISVKQK